MYVKKSFHRRQFSKRTPTLLLLKNPKKIKTLSKKNHFYFEFAYIRENPSKSWEWVRSLLRSKLSRESPIALKNNDQTIQ